MNCGLTESSLGEVCRLVTDGTHDTPKRVPSGFPLVKAKEIVRGQIDFSCCDQISEEDHRKVVARSKPEFGDTLFTHIGASLGAAAFVNTTREFSIKNIALFKPNPGLIHPRYLYYLVVSPGFQSLAIGSKTGSAQPFLSLSQLRGHRIQYHRSLAIQQRIASILSAYDDLIENSQRRIKILEEMARALYREWFVHFRFPGHESVPRVPSPLGEIPQGWEVRNLKDIATVTYGFPFASRNFNANGIGVPVIRIRDIQEGASATFTEEHADVKYHVKNGDILVGMDGDFHMCIWASGHAVQNQRVARFESRGEIGNLHLFLALEKPIQELNKAIVGTTVAHLGDMHIKIIQSAWPPIGVRAKARDVLESMSRQMIELKQKIQNLRRTRDLLLPRLLSGQIDVEQISA
jgi:type I restriction enzyme S subunit